MSCVRQNFDFEQLDMAEGGGSPPPIIPLSPPLAEVDESPLQKQMDRNKECKYTVPSTE